MSRIAKNIVGVVASLAMVVSLAPQSSALSVVQPNQGQLIGVCWNNAVQLYWGSHPNANSNSLQKGDMYPNDSQNFWGWVVQGHPHNSYTDYDVVPGVTYTYRVKYRSNLTSNEVTVTCPDSYPSHYPLPSLTCSPEATNVDSGDWVTFSAYQDWQYQYQYPDHQLTWRAIGGTPASGVGGTFGTRFYADSINETHRVTVSNGYYTSTCTVYVRGERDDLRLTPTSRTVDDGDSVTFHASGGTGSYTWDTNNPNGSYGATGSFWGLRFENYSSYTKTYTVTVRSGNQSRTATVRVRPQSYYAPTPTPYGSLQCYPGDVWVQNGEEAVLRAWGGNGSYQWSTPQGYGSTGYGAHYAVRFYNTTGASRVYDVRVTSGYESRTCKVHVASAPVGGYYPTTTPVPPYYQGDTLTLSQGARNFSDGQIAVTSSVRAGENDTVQFVMTVRNRTNGTVHNVRMTDLLPYGLAYIWSSTTVDGIVVSDGLTSSGINLGTMYAGQTKTVRFSAMVDSSVVPYWGTRTMYNTAQVRGDGTDAEVSRLAVILGTGGVLSAAAGVNTGTEDSLLIAFAVALAATGLYAVYASSGRTVTTRKKELDFSRQA